MNFQPMKGRAYKSSHEESEKLGEAANARLSAAGRQEANKDAFIDEFLDNEIRYTLLKEDPDSFNASGQRIIAVSKQLRKLRTPDPTKKDRTRTLDARRRRRKWEKT